MLVRRRRRSAQWLEWSTTTNNNWTPSTRKKEKSKEKREIEKENPSLLPWCASMRMVEFCWSLSLFSPHSLSLISSGPSLSLSLDYPIDCKYILWRISKCVAHSSRKKSTAQGESEREREKKREETTYDTILQKKAQEENASHVSKQHDDSVAICRLPPRYTYK